MGNAQIWSMFGACVTGFLFLAGWCWFLYGQVKDRVSYKWFESNFMTKCKEDRKEISDKLEKSFDELKASIKEVKDAIIGTVDKKGMRTVQCEHESRLNKLEEKV